LKIVNFVKLLVVLLIRAYQVLLSPFLPPSCIFTPSCSEYAAQAFRQYGFFKALWVSAKRVIRCNPFEQGGFDPLK